MARSSIKSKNSKKRKPVRNTRVKKRQETKDERIREIVGILLLAISIFAAASIVSLQWGTGLFMGPLGRGLARAMYGVFGVSAYLACAVLGLVAWRLLISKPYLFRLREWVGGGLVFISLCTLLHLIGENYLVGGVAAGGAIGEVVGEVLRALVFTPGTVLLAVNAIIIGVVIATPLRLKQSYGAINKGATWVGKNAIEVSKNGLETAKEIGKAILPERAEDDYLDEDLPESEAAEELSDNEPPIIASGRVEKTKRVATQKVAVVPAPTSKKEKKKKKLKGESALPNASEKQEDYAAMAKAIDEALTEEKASAKKKEPKKSVKSKEAKSDVPEANESSEATEESAKEPVIVQSQFSKKKTKEDLKSADEQLQFIPLREGEYKLPPIDLLNYDESSTSDLDKAAMLELSAKLTQTLEHYGVKGEVVAIRPGPVVTMYEFAPALGTRISKIVNLTDDLAMALEALKVRIVAPIPGKAAVGIEVPNSSRETVYLKEIIADETFKKNKAGLPLALGKDIEGAPSTVDLAKMPHLLVAGTTGSGKSVSVNSMITSLLYSASPEDVRMIMVDPKMLELSIYEGIPHLLLPVVTDPKKANLALRWGVDEMERRYELLANMGVRDIRSYNNKVVKKRAEWEAENLRRAADLAQRVADGEEIVEEPEPQKPAPTKLPYIVIIIDEFADLMMVAAKEVETSVARIAQKARAAGIHLILATQRPSVDVITGLIKANFPSRAAFHVTSKVDSRTILDQSGAEALLGAGDMLFSDRGAAPKRLHGCYVDEEEIHEIVEFLKGQGKPVYNMDILKPREEEQGSSDAGDGNEVDEMYDRAKALVLDSGNVSISMIQRRLRIGYNRAARIVEAMEDDGIVGPPDHSNRRQVLISPSIDHM